jgi:hypothetical protein
MPDGGNARCGPTAATLATVAGDGKGIGLDHGIVFFASSTKSSSTLYALDAGGMQHSIATNPVSVSLLGADGGEVVWSTGTEAHLFSAPSATAWSAASTDLGVHLADYQGSYDQPLLGFTGGYVLWSDGKTGLGAYWWLPVTGGTPTGGKLAGIPMSALAAGASILWITSQGAATIGAVPDAAGAAPIPGVTKPAALVGYRAGTAYFPTPGAPFGGTGIDAVDVMTGMVRHIDASVAKPATACLSPGIWGLTNPIVGLDEALYAGRFTDCMSDQKEYVSVLHVRASVLTEVSTFTSTYQAFPPMAVTTRASTGSRATARTPASGRSRAEDGRTLSVVNMGAASGG